MTITPTFLTNGKDRYTLKVACAHDGGTGPLDDTLLILNSVLLAQMAAGPLRDYFDVGGLTYNQASALVLSSSNIQIIGRPEVAPGIAWAFDVEVTTEPGRPSLVVLGSPLSPNYLFEITRRHSIGR